RASNESFVARPLRGSLSCGLQIRSSQSGTQHHLRAIGRRIGQTWPVGRSEGGRYACARASAGLSLQPPVCGRELCPSTCGSPWWRVAGRRAARVARRAASLCLSDRRRPAKARANRRNVLGLLRDAPLVINLECPLRVLVV